MRAARRVKMFENPVTQIKTLSVIYSSVIRSGSKKSAFANKRIYFYYKEKLDRYAQTTQGVRDHHKQYQQKMDYSSKIASSDAELQAWRSVSTYGKNSRIQKLTS